MASELRDECTRKFSLPFLKKLRANAAAFKHDNRLSSVTWTVHLEAGDHETLSAVMKEADHEQEKLTVAFVRQFKLKKMDRASGNQSRTETGANDVSDKSNALNAANKALRFAENFRGCVIKFLGNTSPDDLAELSASAHAVASKWLACADLLREATAMREAAE